MGYFGMDCHLDSNILKFVEPLGPGQVVDRQSLVALPSGYLKVGIEVKNRKLRLCVRGFQRNLRRREKPTKTSVRSFYSIRNHVLEGREVPAEVDDTAFQVTHVFDKFIMERLAFGQIGKTEPAREILQVCVYDKKSQAQHGVVHLAIDDLLNNNNTDGEEKEGWYKVFPHTSFTIGCPIASITAHCVNSCVSEDALPVSAPNKAHITPKLRGRSESCQTPDVCGVPARSNQASGPSKKPKSEEARKKRTYNRVMNACRVLITKAQSRTAQESQRGVPVTVDLFTNKVPTCPSSSSSSVDKGYGSTSSFSPNLLGPLSPEEAIATPARKPKRATSSVGSLKGRLSLHRFSHSFIDFRRASEPQPTSLIQRSQEIISVNPAHDYRRHRTFSCQPQKSAPPLTSEDVLRSSALDISFFASKANPDCNKTSENANATSVRQSNLRPGQQASAEKERTLSQNSIYKRNSVLKMAAKWSRKRGNLNADKEVSSASPRSRPKRESRKSIKTSLSFPPDAASSEEPEMDNVYQVLLALKNNTFTFSKCQALPENSTQSSCSKNEEKSTQRQSEDEIEISAADAPAAAAAAGSERPPTARSTHSDRVKVARKRFASIRENQNQYFSTIGNELKFPQSNVSDDEEYFSCNDLASSAFHSASSSLVDVASEVECA